MKTHTKNYMNFFDFTIADFIPCEICGQRCVDIHHINARQMGGTGSKQTLDEHNKVENLMGMCRRHHLKYGDKKQYLEYITEIHLNYIQTKQPLNTDGL